MPTAIYIKNEDGDWDFVAAFATPNASEYQTQCAQWTGEVVEYLTCEKEAVVVVTADLPLLTNVLDADSPLLPFNPSPAQRNDPSN